MRTLRITLLTAIAMSIAVSLAAQDRPKDKSAADKLSPLSHAMMRMERLRGALEGLDLSAEQKEKLAAIRQEHGPKMKGVFEKIRDVLTEEQRHTAEEAAKKAKEAGKKGREFFQSVESSIKLSDEQKDKLAKFTPEITALRKDVMAKISDVLTPEQREKLKEKMASSRAKGRKQDDKK